MRSLALLAALAAIAVVLVTEPRSASGADTQFNWFTANSLTHDVNKYAQPTQSASTPSNWTSPVNYAGGKVFLRLEVLSRPSTKAIDAQICVWRNSYVQESCSGTSRLGAAGSVSWIDLGSPNSWWKKDGIWSWGSSFSPVRIMLKDVATGTLMMSGSCGASCYSGSDLTSHVPIVLKASAEIVAQGATLVPPTSWTGCPITWSAACSGSAPTNNPPIVDAGAPASVQFPNAATVSGTVSDDGLPTTGSLLTTWSLVSGPGSAAFTTPNALSTQVTFSAPGSYVLRLTGNDGALSASDTTTVTVTSDPPPPSGSVALVAGSTTLPSGDIPLRNRLQSLGHTVVVVDDDALNLATLQAADAVVISSSVVPSKITSVLADLTVPIVSLEAYAHTRLRLGTGGSELASQSTLAMVGGAHPVAAGLTGTPSVSSATTLGRSVPVAGAVKIAHLAGRPSDTTIFAIEAGTALTEGSAPERRVGFYLGYPAPPLLKTAGWQLFDAAVTWAIGDGPPPPDPAAWQFPALARRVPITVDPGATTRTDIPVTVAFDAGSAVPFDPASVRLVEVDAAGNVIDSTVSIQFDPAADFNASTAPRGTLIVLLEGSTTSARRFHAYFEGPAAPAVAPLVTVTQGVVDAGQTSLRIDTPAGDWFYHLQGGGFSSLVDNAGNDWLSYSTTAGSAGAFRGVPNAVYPAGHFHPGATTSTTALVSSGPLRASFESTTNDGLWKTRWDVYPTFARMTMLRSNGNYWFLYEGTPGGQIDATTDKVIRANGTVTNLDVAWSGDISGEWAAFADTVRGRSLFVAQTTEDTSIDSYYLMEGNMTVFGFGRQNVSRYLTGQREFVVGLVDTTTHSGIQPSVVEATAPFTVVSGAPEVQGTPT